MKLKSAISEQLVISCCHPDPDTFLYGTGPIVNKLLKDFKFWWGASILTNFLDLLGTSLVHREVHCPVACKLSHSTCCYSANQICAIQAITIELWKQTEEWAEKQVTNVKSSERYRERRQSEERTGDRGKITPHGLFKSWWMFPQSC